VNQSALIRATLIGTALQLAMVIAGHMVPALRDPGFALGGMGFSALAGWLFARGAGAGWGASLVGGAIAGGVCAVIGIGVSVALGDVPPSLLGLGTASSVVTGVIGAAIARFFRRA
jgi:hypothetical protein